ncbi:MAG: hypothetical protein ACOZHQ_00540 [Thermodesulfobacteriota bacterium]
MKIKSTQPSVIGNWFWCDPFGGRTNQAICRERLARSLPYSPCRHCQRFGEGKAEPSRGGGAAPRRD